VYKIGKQRYISIKKACSFSGEYKIDFSKSACTTCSVLESSVTIKIESDNKCADVEQVFGATATFETFSDSTFTTPATSYSIGSRVYFLIPVDEGPKFTIDGVSLFALTLRPIGGVPIALVKDGFTVVYPTILDPQVDLQISAGSASNLLSVSLNISEKLASYLISNNQLSFAVGAEIKMYLSGTYKKRSILLEDPEQKTSLSSSFSISGYSVPPKDEIVFIEQDYNNVNPNTVPPTSTTVATTATTTTTNTPTTLDTNVNNSSIESLLVSILFLSIILVF